MFSSSARESLMTWNDLNNFGSFSSIRGTSIAIPTKHATRTSQCSHFENRTTKSNGAVESSINHDSQDGQENDFSSVKVWQNTHFTASCRGERTRIEGRGTRNKIPNMYGSKCSTKLELEGEELKTKLPQLFPLSLSLSLSPAASLGTQTVQLSPLAFSSGNQIVFGFSK